MWGPLSATSAELPWRNADEGPAEDELDCMTPKPPKGSVFRAGCKSGGETFSGQKQKWESKAARRTQNQNTTVICTLRSTTESREDVLKK